MRSTPWAWGIVLWFVAAAPAAEQSLVPWGANHHPSDVAGRHVQEIRAGRADYVVIQGGTMDGRNCRSPQGVWQPFEQTWESNRSVRLENVGETDVVNPWLSNGQNDFRSLDHIVARATVPAMNDGEKARALWWQEIQHRFHFDGDNSELGNPIKVFNIYGYNTCGNDSICLAGQWRRAGLKAAPARLVGHCASQVFYNGTWHLMDGDMHAIYLLRDNETVAGEQDLARDHDLIRRTHTQGILEPDRRAGDEWESSLYVFEGAVTGDRNSDGASLSMTLRPGEAIEWRWGHQTPIRYHGPRPPKFPDRVCNGQWEYLPDFSGSLWPKGAITVKSIREGRDGLAAQEGETGVVVWKLGSPYVIVGGRLEAEETGARFQLSWDGKSWQDVDQNLDSLFPPQGPARYAYYVRCELSGPARLKRLRIRADLQMAPLTLPGMAVGSNPFTYTDESVGERHVRITHQWVERSASAPPVAPAAPIFPADGGAAEGTKIAFRWQPATDSDGDAIADYHFELSARADMKWPLSMSFAKLTSRTGDAGQARFMLPEPGLLNPDTTYYWHVRARDAQGVWGPWSATWSFTPKGPAPPQKLSLTYDGSRSRGVLRWEPGNLGRVPASYRIYASDEKGFSVSDRSYKVAVGASASLAPEFPANFVAETAATELEVLGSQVAAPGANKAFYRVIAVDASGTRSGPSDYAAATRPIVFSQPVTRAANGASYRYPVKAIRSLGDLRTRVIDGKEVMSFWDIERVRFELERGPAWLAIDRVTGVLSGKPDQSGTYAVTVAVTLEHEARRLEEAALKWGIEKVASSETEIIGRATQSFVIDVGS
jgi:hypothetical protein